MKPSEKIGLVRSVSEKLATEDVSIINLTLEEYGIPPLKPKRQKTFDIVLKALSAVPAHQLADLARHLEIELPDSEGSSLWKKEALRIFVSHVSSHKEEAAELRAALERYGIFAFVAHETIVPSRQWIDELDRALQTCDALVALMDKGFHKSQWTDHEVGFAYGRGIPVIPVDIGQKPYGIIAKIQACPYEDMEKLGETIFKLMINDSRTARKMSYAAMAHFENSNSFAASNQNLKVLKKLKYWDNTLLERLKAAPRKNDQIRGSFDVPEGVQLLARRVKKMGV